MLRRRFTVMRFITGRSPRASVSDPNVWQFAVLRSADPLRGDSNRVVFSLFGTAVSSIT